LLFVGTAFAQTFDVVRAFDNSNESPMTPLLAASDGNLYLPTWGGGTGQGTIYRLTPDGSGGYTCTMIHAFSGGDGTSPSGGLVEGPDGLLYGVTFVGGAFGDGVLYSISTSGTFEVVRDFQSTDAQGPFGELVVGPDGKLYGTSAVGGAGDGSVYRYDPSNGNFEVVYIFGYLTGANPQAGLLLASDGKLYGTTPNGGDNGFGTIFRIDTSGNFELLYSFAQADGIQSYGVLAELGGSIYGSGAPQSGPPGAIFRWNDATGFAVVHAFSGPDGSKPTGGLVQVGGFLYGTTQGGGALGRGNLFQSDAAGNVTSLHDFVFTDGVVPSAHPIRVGTSWIGTTMTSGPGFSGTVYQLPDSTPLSVVCAFGQGLGYNLLGALVEASDGNLYGTTEYGGLYFGQGTIFRLGKDGSVSTIHSFNGFDGASPVSDLVAGSDGALYGVTTYGGTNNEGVAFRIDLGGTFSLPHQYSLDDSTGGDPTALAVGPDGQLYGATSEGGGCGGAGELYRMTIDGTITNLHAQCLGSAYGPLLSASDGFLYGIQGSGVVFQLSTAGDFSTIANDPIGNNAYLGRGLVEGPDQGFYGAASVILYNAELFRIRADGRHSVLHTFIGSSGSSESATRLLAGSDGRLYGGSFSGTGDDPGTVFRMNVYGDLEVLHTFDPAEPETLWPLMQASDGKLYGVTGGYTPNSTGLVYSIDLGTQINEISPSSGPAVDTAPVAIAGAAFQDGASIAVGGVPATDVVVTSATQATATVPVLFPGTLNDVVLTNPDTTTGTLKNGWFADFLDVAQADPFHSFVEKVFRSHVASGYGSGFYGRDDAMTRAQMAVFLVKGGLGPGTIPEACSGQFVDVPCPSLFADWIEKLRDEQISSGCQQFPPMYCPGANVTRAQMAVFLLKTLHGSSYVPPACTGIFQDVACPGAFAVDWIEDLYNSEITAGCSVAPPLYCPDGPVSRGQMAVFVVRAFGLP